MQAQNICKLLLQRNTFYCRKLFVLLSPLHQPLHLIQSGSEVLVFVCFYFLIIKHTLSGIKEKKNHKRKQSQLIAADTQRKCQRRAVFCILLAFLPQNRVCHQPHCMTVLIRECTGRPVQLLPFMKSAVDTLSCQHCPRSQTKYSELIGINKLNRSDAPSKNPLVLSLSIHELFHTLMLQKEMQKQLFILILKDKE